MIRAELRNCKLSRKTLSNIIGVSQKTIWNWANEGMPKYSYDKGTYYLLEDTLNWMKCQPKKMELYINVRMKLER